MSKLTKKELYELQEHIIELHNNVKEHIKQMDSIQNHYILDQLNKNKMTIDEAELIKSKKKNKDYIGKAIIEILAEKTEEIYRCHIILKILENDQNEMEQWNTLGKYKNISTEDYNYITDELCMKKEVEEIETILKNDNTNEKNAWLIAITNYYDAKINTLENTQKRIRINTNKYDLKTIKYKGKIYDYKKTTKTINKVMSSKHIIHKRIFPKRI